MGFSAIGPLLWARAMLGPAVVFIGAIAMSHGLLRPAAAESSRVWLVVVLATAAAAAIVVTWPLEKRR